MTTTSTMIMMETDVTEVMKKWSNVTEQQLLWKERTRARNSEGTKAELVLTAVASVA